MSHRIITTIRGNSSSPKWGSIHFFSTTTTESELCIVVVILLHGASYTTPSVGWEKFPRPWRQRQRPGNEGKKRLKVARRCINKLDFLSYFSFIIITIIFFRTFPFLERLYIWHGRRSLLVSPQSPLPKKRLDLCLVMRVYIQTGSNSWSPWTAKKRIDQKIYFVFFLTFSIVNMSGSNETKMHKPKTQMGTI